MASDTALIVRRDNLLDCRLVELEKTALGPGQAELSVDRFAFTSNNVTYGALGEALSYWNFFPTGVEGYGLSRCGDLAPSFARKAPRSRSETAASATTRWPPGSL